MASNKSSKPTPTVNPSDYRTPTPDETRALATVSAETAGAIETFNPSDFARRAADGWIVQKVVKLPEGTQLKGTFMGKGPAVDVTDAGSGEVRAVPTWRIRHEASKMMFLLMTGYQLDREFGGDGQTFGMLMEETPVMIAKLRQEATSKGRRVNDYAIAYPPDAKRYPPTGEPTGPRAGEAPEA